MNLLRKNHENVYNKDSYKNFKRFSDWFELELTPNVNIIVGVNEIGKSTIIEAIV